MAAHRLAQGKRQAKAQRGARYRHDEKPDFAGEPGFFLYAAKSPGDIRRRILHIAEHEIEQRARILIWRGDRMAEADSNLLIVSDTHLSEGFRPETGKWSPNEDFLADKAFADFLRFHETHRRNGLPWKLIIAGDGFEFLQILSLPAADPHALQRKVTHYIQDENASPLRHHVALPEMRRRQALTRLDESVEVMQERFGETHRVLIEQAQRLKGWGENINPERLWDLEHLTNEICILACRKEPYLSKSERNYGLGTTEPEAVWKLDRIAEGHPIFFSALAWFLDRGNSLVIMKGNHDVELFWPGVQERIRELILDAAADLRLSDPRWSTEPISLVQNLPQLAEWVHNDCTFAPWIYFKPGVAYIEHGNQYELADFFENFLYPVLQFDPRRLRLPPGAFFVRYFFNKVEETFPFADNLRPITRVITWTFKNRLRDMIRLFTKHGPGLWKFVKVLVSRSFKDYFRDRRRSRLRYRKVHSGDELRAAEKWQSTADNYHIYTLANLARGNLSLEHLERIEDEAFVKRVTPLRKIFRFMVVVVPPLLIILFLLLVFVGPFVWQFLVSASFDMLLDSYLNHAVILGILGFLLKSILVPLIFSKDEGVGAYDYMFAASKKVWKILSDPMDAGSAPVVKYLVFGHTHDPDCRKVSRDPSSPWYINTGSWLQRVDEIDRWDQLQRDYTYLMIVVGEETTTPGLYRWNPASAQPERLRLRTSEQKQSGGQKMKGDSA
ncbi:MAG: hypothetical protein P8Y98_00250 [Anaerolineales bacterium]